MSDLQNDLSPPPSNTTPDSFLGPLRVILPAVTTYIVGKGWIPAPLATPEVGAALATLGFALWSYMTNRKTALVAKVAALPETAVSPQGTTIHIVDPTLQAAVKDAATPNTSPIPPK